MLIKLRICSCHGSLVKIHLCIPVVLRHSWIPGRNFPWPALCFLCCVPALPVEVRESSTTPNLESKRASLSLYLVFLWAKIPSPCEIQNSLYILLAGSWIHNESKSIMCVFLCVPACVGLFHSDPYRILCVMQRQYIMFNKPMNT